MCFLHFRWYNPIVMKKLFKVIGYILLSVILLSTLVLVAARFLAPQIIEKVLVRDLAKSGYNATVDIEIDRLSPFGIEIPVLKVDLGGEELELSDLVLDVESLLSSKHELRFEIGNVDLNLTDELLSYLEANGVPEEKLVPFKGRDISLSFGSPYVLANYNDIYVELETVDFGFTLEDGFRALFSTGSIKATANMNGENLMVTPFDINLNGSRLLSFDSGLYSEGRDELNVGHVTVHKYHALPDVVFSDLVLSVVPRGLEANSSRIALSGLDMAADFFDAVETDEAKVLFDNGGKVIVDTCLIFSGDRKILDVLGIEMTLVMDSSRLEVNEGTVFHQKLKGRIPFELAFEGSEIEIEIAGSKRFGIDMDNPSEAVVSEMISFVLLKLASSIFGL